MGERKVVLWFVCLYFLTTKAKSTLIHVFMSPLNNTRLAAEVQPSLTFGRTVDSGKQCTLMCIQINYATTWALHYGGQCMCFFQLVESQRIEVAEEGWTTYCRDPDNKIAPLNNTSYLQPTSSPTATSESTTTYPVTKSATDAVTGASAATDATMASGSLTSVTAASTSVTYTAASSSLATTLPANVIKIWQGETMQYTLYNLWATLSYYSTFCANEGAAMVDYETFVDQFIDRNADVNALPSWGYRIYTNEVDGRYVKIARTGAYLYKWVDPKAHGSLYIFCQK